MAKKKDLPILEETLARLEMAVEKLQSDDITLEAAFKAYQEGMDCVKSCHEAIDKIEKQVLILEQDGSRSIMKI